MTIQALAPSVVTHTGSKGTHYMKKCASSWDRAQLSEEEAQRVNQAPGFNDLLDRFIADNRRNDRFKNEETKSNYTYPPEFRGPKPIALQIVDLATKLGLDPDSAIRYAQHLPDLASFVPADALLWTGWYAFAKDAALNRVFAKIVSDDPNFIHCAVINVILGKIAESRPFYNYRDGQITPDRLRQLERNYLALIELAKMQGDGDILVAPFQLGMLHRGCSTRRSRERFVSNEYGADSVQGGSIALTHPERFVRWQELDMDLPGDEFDDPDSDVRFDHAPYLNFNDKLKFDTKQFDNPNDNFGSASWFLPKYLF